ncbi:MULTISPECIES: aa3-type cytochrome c oxidase subunit IV [Methylosinus]|uniref:Aa3-type cytochrome c oxidase subunit IV n=1 Tax=Methylosinus trichosporium (strain ATCC 35070 / NCIMB 11131 / UNIQEM 75 / OB3b) TaxID=595536 RepID=A0A2D2D170_METT3|nr:MULTISPECIES: aa3-type cytochrome c oxidase subunit IV [Methylosinus]ATQ68714.1 aa3-type cytochrome c oxidase subunit IV [Methylosinus trichosporium OB3b]OBS53128.1 cytochrome C oxidase subunit IV [Methylosinus sp. 3S-1]
MGEHHKVASSAEFAEHEATYKGFLTLLKVSTAACVVTLLLLFFFVAH